MARKLSCYFISSRGERIQQVPCLYEVHILDDNGLLLASRAQELLRGSSLTRKVKALACKLRGAIGPELDVKCRAMRTTGSLGGMECAKLASHDERLLFLDLGTVTGLVCPTWIKLIDVSFPQALTDVGCLSRLGLRSFRQKIVFTTLMFTLAALANALSGHMDI